MNETDMCATCAYSIDEKGRWFCRRFPHWFLISDPYSHYCGEYEEWKDGYET